jgi:hypothetical protein
MQRYSANLNSMEMPLYNLDWSNGNNEIQNFENNEHLFDWVNQSQILGNRNDLLSFHLLNPYDGLKWSVKEINHNFKIKVNGVNFTGKKMNTLVGVSGLINLIGIDLCNILLERAFKSTDDKCICRLRRGLKVTFYNY